MNIHEVDILKLIESDTRLRQTSTSFKGGQWSGACPFPNCGGVDRFNVWPFHPSGKGRYWCRQCGASGDAIDYVRLMDGLGYVEACERLEVSCNEHTPQNPRPAPSITAPPPVLWQEMAGRFVSWAEAKMWEFPDNPARAYLHDGGLTDETIKAARIGWNPRKMFRKPATWGLDGKAKVFLGKGAVIPLFAQGVLWGVKIRYLPPNKYNGVEQKYGGPRGGVTCLSGMDSMRPGYPALLVEGERDFLLARQELCPLVDVVTLGGNQKTIPSQAVAALLNAAHLFIAFDGDLAGMLGRDKILSEVAYQATALNVPQGYDLTAMHQKGIDLRAWFAYSIAGLLGVLPGVTLEGAIEGLVKKLGRLKND